MSAEYYYRRRLGAKDLLPAIGVGVATGLAGFYIVQLLIQRTPLVPQGELPRAPTDASANECWATGRSPRRRRTTLASCRRAAARRSRVERVKRRRRVRLAFTALAFSAAFLGGSSARAQDINCDRGDLEVMRLEFEGNRAFSDAELAKDDRHDAIGVGASLPPPAIHGQTLSGPK